MDLTVRITGNSPLLQHNIRLANPLDPIARQMKVISGKRKKTEDDFIEMAHLEFLGGLYIDAQGPYLPGEWFYRSAIDGGRISKQGTKFMRGVIVQNDFNHLSYEGPKEAEELWKNENFRLMASVRIGQARVIRCRPIFREWSTEVPLYVDTELIELDEVKRILYDAGHLIGIGDWRPRYGRYSAEIRNGIH